MPLPETNFLPVRDNELPTERSLRITPAVRDGASPTLPTGRQWLARGPLVCLYGATIVLSAVAKRLQRPPRGPIRRVVATARFDSFNWFRAHAAPLAQCGLERAVFVADDARLSLPHIGLTAPPRWLSRLFGRAGAKLIWLLVAGARNGADLFVGYHIVPAALSALLAARLLGRRACYQMTGGPTELVGGGWQAENPVLSALGTASPMLERLALAVVRQFDLIVVRGAKAEGFLRSRGVVAPIVVIPGSIAPAEPSPARDIDLVFVGRLNEIKQPLQFVDLVSRVRVLQPNVRAVVVGDGPLGESAKTLARDLGVDRCIEFMGAVDDVAPLLGRSRVFALTSRSEGLSIALAEAMTAGAVPVVPDIGDLSALVADGQCGFLVRPADLDQQARRIHQLLRDHALWERMSKAAASAALNRCSISAVAARWRNALDEITQ